VSTALHAYCDAATARCVAPGPAAHHPGFTLAACILASGLAFVDGSVINVALPAIGHALDVDAGALQWCINAYLLPLSAMLLLGGAVGDRFGRRRVLILGVLAFAFASAACALTPGLALLLAARFCQGAGAAMLMPNSLAILGQAFSGAAKGRAIGAWAATSAVASAVGPVLGGWLVDLGSWRAIFLINLPLAAGAILLAWRFAPDNPDGPNTRLDVRGAWLVTIGLGSVTWALTLASGHGWSRTGIGAVIAGLLLLAAFLLVERHRRDWALMPLELFASRSLIWLSILTFLLYGALGALLILLPYVLIEACGYSATAAGAALLPLPLILTVSSPTTGAFAARAGARVPLAVGSLLCGLGFLLTLRIHAHANYWTGVLPALLVISVGLASTAAPLTTAVLSSADARNSGAASGLNSALARTGGLLATASLGGVLAPAGGQLLTSFHGAMGIAALACLGAFLSAIALPIENL